jgi:mRNA interferase HicA
MQSGHLKVTRSSRVSYIPMHGSNRELGKGLVERIKKDLGLKGD